MNGVEVPGTARGNGQNRRTHRCCSFRRAVDILATARTLPNWLLRMQAPPKSDVTGLLQRLVSQELPSGGALEAWDSFLRAHATLMRRLEVDLAQATGLALADFDVLAQLARAGGELRMTDLATRTLVSRSGMTRSGAGRV